MTNFLRNKILSVLLGLSLAIASLHAAAQHETPSDTVTTMVESILSILQREAYSTEDRDLIRQAVYEGFDSRAMAQSVLSTNWKAASIEQQTEFEALFFETLENTYIGRLEAYTNEKVEYHDESIKQKRASVETFIITSNKKIPINYKLRLRSNGWFIYDVEVENASMVSSYRETYRSVIRRSGMDDLLTQMREKIAQFSQ